MSEWSLPQLLASLHEDIEKRLSLARKSFSHPGTKGDASEQVWLQLLETYLPTRYRVTKAHAVDSKGAFSHQLDVVVFDRQYSPFIFNYEGQTIIPAESIYAVFEAKQTINTDLVSYAKEKIASVRNLHRTTLPIPHAGGKFAAKELTPILGGILTFESDWSPPLSNTLVNALSETDINRTLDIGCVAAHGTFWQEETSYTVKSGGKPATDFLLELIARLQTLGTVPMMDVKAYARWLS